MEILRRKLSAQFSLVLILVFVVGTAIISVFTWQRLYQTTEAEVLQNVDAQNRLVAASLDAIYRDSDKNLHTILGGLTQLIVGPYALTTAEQLNIGGQTVPALRAGNTLLTGNNTACDQVTGMTGAVCSMFVRRGEDMVRIASSVKKPDGSRAVGTLMKKDAVYTALLKGDDYLSLVVVEQKSFMALYRPIKDAQQNVIGCIAVGFDLSSRLTEFKKQLADIRIGETGYYAVVDATPGREGTFVVHPKLEGKNVLDGDTDINKEFGRQILEKRGGTIHYRWRNPDEKQIRDKVAQLRAVDTWNWILVAGTYQEELTRSGQSTVIGLLIGLIAQSFLMVILIGWLFGRFIGKPLEVAEKTIASIAAGDLSQRVETTRSDEIGSVLRSVESMRTSLSTMIGEVRHAAEELGQRGKSLLEAARHSGRSADEQSDSAGAIAAAMEELHASLGAIDHNAVEVREFASQADQQSQRGAQVISQTTGEMRQIAERIADSSTQVQRLANEAGNITEIVGVIQGLADQTNLLALNAAIEAARAGEAGRGFAVVADEVRKLAEGTRQSTERISKVIGDIQTHSREASEAMATVTERVDHGVHLSDEAQSAIETISHSADDLRARLDEITDSLREQNTAGSSIASKAEIVARKSEETSEDAGRVINEVGQMEKLAQQLAATVSRFRL
jgi:methyl-accepting chemotaxis protein